MAPGLNDCLCWVLMCDLFVSVVDRLFAEATKEPPVLADRRILIINKSLHTCGEMILFSSRFGVDITL